MTPAQENELLRTIRSLKKELSEIRELVIPIAPKKDEILNFNQSKDLLKFSERKLRQLVADGEIPYSKKGGRLKFSRNTLLNWLNQ